MRARVMSRWGSCARAARGKEVSSWRRRRRGSRGSRRSRARPRCSRRSASQGRRPCGLGEVWVRVWAGGGECGSERGAGEWWARGRGRVGAGGVELDSGVYGTKGLEQHSSEEVKIVELHKDRVRAAPKAAAWEVRRADGRGGASGTPPVKHTSPQHLPYLCHLIQHVSSRSLPQLQLLPVLQPQHFKAAQLAGLGTGQWTARGVGRERRACALGGQALACWPRLFFLTGYQMLFWKLEALIVCWNSMVWLGLRSPKLRWKAGMRVLRSAAEGSGPVQRASSGAR